MCSKKHTKALEYNQTRAARLECLSSEEQLRTLGLSTLEKTKPEGASLLPVGP